MRFIAVVLGMLAGALWLAACGDEDESRPVALTISAPADAAVVRDEEVEVTGRVRPAGADVVVGGRAATVTGREFRVSVPLDEGANVIDVGASADGRAAAFRAIRVSRRVVIEIPDLGGDSRDDAVEKLEDLGLRPDVDEEGGLLDRFLPARWSVCRTDPEPGIEVDKGARVQVTISRAC
jgi:Glucodextranase, domain B/PASTA domain